MPAVGSLYSGIGGGDLGFRLAGYRVAWQAERDPWRARVLAARFPAVPVRFRDVADVPGAAEPVDVVYAGLPSRDPAWLAAGVWPVVDALRPALLVVDAGVRCRDALVVGLGARGYAGVGLTVATRVRFVGAVSRERALVAVAARAGGAVALAGLLAETEAADVQADVEPPGRPPVTAVEVFETLRGLPAGWTCACGAPDPGLCTETSARLVAANEALGPAVTAWLGARLLELAAAGVAAEV